MTWIGGWCRVYSRRHEVEQYLRIYANCLSKHNRCAVDCQLDFLFTNHLWIRFKEKCDYSLSDCMARKETEIDARSAKYFRQSNDNQQWLQTESFNALPSSFVFSIAFNDKWCSSMQLLSYEFLRVYYRSHIYSLDASDLLEKIDSLVAESLSIEVSLLFLIDVWYIIVFTNHIYYYFVDWTEKCINNILYLWIVLMCLQIGES